MKIRGASLAIALLAWVLLLAMAVAVFRGMRERDILETRNTLERTLNALFASLRDHDDFGSAIESSSELSARVFGLGVYTQEGRPLYSWGMVPATWEASPAASTPREGQSRATDPAGGHGASGGDPAKRDALDRNYLENPKHSSFILLLHPFRFAPPPPRPEEPPRPDAAPDPGSPGREVEHPFLFQTLKDAEVVYLEVLAPDYWNAERFRDILFPLVAAALAALVLLIRALVLRNTEYRRRLEEQRSLVVLGTAAATLAHEIKNPLMSIRLQTGILERTCPAEAGGEIRVINAEVDRLAALAYRVNDYLREPKGQPRPVDAAGAAREVSVRIAGRDLVGAAVPEALALVDPDRLRSMLENLVGNALECGGPPEGLGIEVRGDGGTVAVEVLDRGPGVPEADRERVFDPFFTTKSRGTGIGLAVSRRFARAAGGELSIASRPGGGCLARLVLPAAEAGEE